MIWEQGAIDVIPSKSNRMILKEFDKQMYRQRNKIERFFCRLKASFRHIATRYEQTSANFLAMIKFASVRLCFKFYEYAIWLPNKIRSILCQGYCSYVLATIDLLHQSAGLLDAHIVSRGSKYSNFDEKPLYNQDL